MSSPGQIKETHIVNNDGHKFSQRQDEIRDLVASPEVRQQALVKEIDIFKIKGSGENRRILLEVLEEKNSETENIESKTKVPQEQVKVEEPQNVQVEKEITKDENRIEIKKEIPKVEPEKEIKENTECRAAARGTRKSTNASD